MNNVVLMGRLTKDPDIRRTNDGTAIGRFTLAVDRMKKDEADFIGCVTFGKTAEFAEKYLRKGTKICGSGRIQTGSYTNKDGQKVYTTDVILERLEFAESKASAQPEAKPDGDGFMNIPDDVDDAGLPFN
jgi:single-strand DNA-binding protein